MDIETKEAVLKLAGYEVKPIQKSTKGQYGMWYQVERTVDEYSDRGFAHVLDRLAYSDNRNTAINLAYNTFLTRQNDVVEAS